MQQSAVVVLPSEHCTEGVTGGGEERRAEAVMGSPTPPKEEAPAPKKPRLLELDGLRAFACLLVLLHHGVYNGGHFRWPEIDFGAYSLSLPYYLLHQSGNGVNIFFILSGFVASYSYFARTEREIAWKSHFASRCRRILPAYFIALTFFLLAAIVANLLPFPQLEGVRRTMGLPELKYVIAAYLLIAVWGNPAFWSLTVEIRFHLFFPQLLRKFQAKARAGTREEQKAGFLRLATASLVGAALLAVAYFGLKSSTHPTIVKIFYFVSPLPRFVLEFVAGMILAFLHARYPDLHPQRRRQLSLLGPVMVALAMVIRFIIGHHESPETQRLLASVFPYAPVLAGNLLFKFSNFGFATGLTLIALYNPVGQRFFTWGPLIALSFFSYQVYLLHQPIYMTFHAYTRHFNWPEPLQFFFYMVVAPLLVLPLAWWFRERIEVPLLEFIDRRPWKKTEASAPAAA